MPHPLMEAIRNRLNPGVGGKQDPRGMVGILARGNAPSIIQSQSKPTPGVGDFRARAAQANRSLSSGNNPGLRLGQTNRAVDKRPVPALTSSNPHQEAMRRRLSRAQNGPRMNASYRE